MNRCTWIEWQLQKGRVAGVDRRTKIGGIEEEGKTMGYPLYETAFKGALVSKIHINFKPKLEAILRQNSNRN